jgi:hypothetical protein
MKFRTTAVMLGLVGIVWLFVETGTWARGILLCLGENGLFWLLWLFAWLTVVLGAMCFDLWRQSPLGRRARH